MNRIKQLREEKGWSQEDLGRMLSVQKSAVSKYENERIPLTGETLILLSKIFNVSIDYLLGITDIRHPTDELIKKGTITVNVEEPSKLYKISKDLPEKEREELESYADYLRTKSKLNDSEKESSATSETIEDIKEKAN